MECLISHFKLGRFSSCFAQVLAMVLTLLAGCGGGGGGGNDIETPLAVVPTFELSFPPLASRTDAQSLGFVGNSTGSGNAASVTLSSGASSVELQQNPDGEWSGDLPLSEGDNQIVATVRTTDGGTRTETVASVLSRLSIRNAQDLLIDDDLAYVLDDELVELDVATGIGRRISLPTSDSLFDPIAKLHGKLNGRILASSRFRVFLIDPVTEDVDTIFGGSGDAVVRGSLPSEFEYDAQAQQLIVNFGSRVAIADLSGAIPENLTLGQSVEANLSGTTVGYDPRRRNLVTLRFNFGLNTTPSLHFTNIDNGDTSEVTPTHNGRPVFVSSIFPNTTDQSLTVIDAVGQFFSLDFTTGALQQVRSISSPEQASTLIGVHEFADQWQALERSRGRILRINKADGQQSILFESGIGQGPSLGGAIGGLRMDSQTQRLIVTSAFAVYSVELAAGDRQLVANDFPFLNESGVTGGLFALSGDAGSALSILPNESEAYYVGFGPEREIKKVSLETGDLETVASLDAFSDETRVAPIVSIDPENRVAYLLDRVTGGLFSQLELDSGAVVTMDAPDFGGVVSGLKWDATGQRLLFTTFDGFSFSGFLRIYGLSPVSGESRLIGETNVEDGQILFGSSIQQLGLSSDGERLYVGLSGNGRIAEVSLGTGVIRLLDGNAPRGFIPTTIEVTDSGALFASDSGATIFAINPASGETVMLSR